MQEQPAGGRSGQGARAGRDRRVRHRRQGGVFGRAFLGCVYVGLLGSGLEGKAKDVWTPRNKFGLGTKEVQMTMCDFRLSQEDRKPGSGPDRPSTQPRWKESHEQKKGVHIGESRIPAQNENSPRQEK
eukprot:10696943-Heterocapsa_arctica.AAC.1